MSSYLPNVEPRDLLATGLDKLGLELSEPAIDRLLNYLNLLQRWNSAYNLTAIRDPREMIIRHLLDSLAVAPFIHAASSNHRSDRIIDVGSGAGLPGIPLAIALANISVTLLDSALKRARFLTQVKHTLALSQVEVVHARVEDYRAEAYRFAIARAFAPLWKLLPQLAGQCGKGGKILAMTGRYPAEELSQLDPIYRLEECHPLHIPWLEAERHLLIFNPRGTK